jgi:chorismate mutase
MDEKTKQEKINEMADNIKYVFDVLGTKSDINRMILNDKELRDFLLERIEFYRLFAEYKMEKKGDFDNKEVEQ